MQNQHQQNNKRQNNQHHNQNQQQHHQNNQQQHQHQNQQHQCNQQQHQNQQQQAAGLDPVADIMTVLAAQVLGSADDEGYIGQDLAEILQAELLFNR